MNEYDDDSPFLRHGSLSFNSKSTNRECFLAYKAEGTVFAWSHKAVVGMWAAPRIPHQCCRRVSPGLEGMPGVCRRSAWPSAGPSPRGPAREGCQNTWPSLATLLPAKRQASGKNMHQSMARHFWNVVFFATHVNKITSRHHGFPRAVNFQQSHRICRFLQNFYISMKFCKIFYTDYAN